MSGTKNKIKTGISGFGRSGKVFHAPIINSCDETILYGINTSNDDARDFIKKNYPHTTVFTSYEDLLNSEIDLIVLPTPNDTHFELAKKALEAGKNVVIDKPMTITSTQASELIKISKEKNLVLSVYHNRRWDTDFLTLKNILSEKRLGTIHEAEINFNRFRDYLKDDWREKAIPGAGILYDLGPHLIDQALNLFGMPVELYADIRKERSEANIEDSFLIILFYQKLKVILKAGMLASYPGPKILVQGSKGAYLKFGLDPQENLLKEGTKPQDLPDHWGKESYEKSPLIINPDGTRQKVIAIPGDYRGYYSNIADAINNNKDLEVSALDGYNTIKIIEAAFKASQEKRTIKL
ncbi:oxidoreductase [Mangrovivirga sp. M17]|uniref:Oxidoreductase n=1 Tax=Mangrovivirga halotolerans TaxID=2993936 RepID=A0ABT3RMD8_9BACT|nr:oxidoreductase [Mangrovivirga halotolerans]MCX2742976.1 oxidoreductase [Mangrovivirga halotolerans]